MISFKSFSRLFLFSISSIYYLFIYLPSSLRSLSSTSIRDYPPKIFASYSFFFSFSASSSPGIICNSCMHPLSKIGTRAFSTIFVTTLVGPTTLLIFGFPLPPPFSLSLSDSSVFFFFFFFFYAFCGVGCLVKDPNASRAAFFLSAPSESESSSEDPRLESSFDAESIELFELKSYSFYITLLNIFEFFYSISFFMYSSNNYISPNPHSLKYTLGCPSGLSPISSRFYLKNSYNFNIFFLSKSSLLLPSHSSR